MDTPVIRHVFLVQHYFTVNFSHENQKALELRTEDAKDRDEWVAAIAHARYVSPRPTVQAEETDPKPQKRGVAEQTGRGDDSLSGPPPAPERRALPPWVPRGRRSREGSTAASQLLPQLAAFSVFGKLSTVWLGEAFMAQSLSPPGSSPRCMTTSQPYVPSGPLISHL